MPSDDNFTVNIANYTSNALNPSSSNFEYGDFGSNPVSIPPNTSTAIEAFEVQGKIGDGPQGTVTYAIDNYVQAVFQFNNNVGGNDGNDYFFAGLQPQQSGNDTSGYYLQVTGFVMPAAMDQSAFTVGINVYVDDGSNYNVTPITFPSMDGFDYLYGIYVVNNTGSVMTLNQLAGPLNGYIQILDGGRYAFQPWVATTLLPQSSPQLLAVARVVPYPGGGGGLNLQVSYNLADGAILNINYDWQVGSTPEITLTGANTSKYTFSSTSATETPEPGYDFIQLTITVSTAGQDRGEGRAP